MRVHAFKVKILKNKLPLATLLEQIKNDNLAIRVRTVLSDDYRVDDVTLKDGKWFIDAIKYRDTHGPGAASRDKPTRGFSFNENEVFSEETSLLFDPEISYAIVQYNHYGPRAGAIQDYLNSYAKDDIFGIELRPRFDENAEARFANRHATRKLCFAIDPRLLNEKDYESGVPLSKAVELGKGADAAKIEISISVGRERTRGLNGAVIEKTIKSLKSLIKNNPDAVSKIEASILPQLDSKLEIVDLLEHRLVHEFKDVPLGLDRRYPRKERYKTLLRAHALWKNRLS